MENGEWKIGAKRIVSLISDFRLRTANCQLPTANFQLSTFNYLIGIPNRTIGKLNMFYVKKRANY